jgi:type II secretion system protein I
MIRNGIKITSTSKITKGSRCAFTLLEVILALAIFGGAVAVLGELVRAGLRNADEARDMNRGVPMAESIMARILAGEMTASAVTDTPCDDQPQWLYSVSVDATEQTSMLKVTVTVRPDRPAALHPKAFSLSRLMVDPSVLQASTSTTQSSQSSGSTTGGATQP